MNILKVFTIFVFIHCHFARHPPSDNKEIVDSNEKNVLKPMNRAVTPPNTQVLGQTTRNILMQVFHRIGEYNKNLNCKLLIKINQYNIENPYRNSS